MRVQTVAKSAGDEVPGNVAMRDLPERMHTCVRAARAVNADDFAADCLDCIFQRTLDRRAVILHLPAAERCTVIFDRELIAGHQLSRAGGVSGVPRRNSSAFMGCFPARCNSRMRMAPCSQAMVRRSSSNSPGAPDLSATSQRRILTL